MFIGHLLKTAEWFSIRSTQPAFPATPQRIATLSFPALVNSLILGFQPIASTNFDRRGYAFPSYQDKVIASLGGNAEPNIETLSLLKPDLILGWHMNNSGAYPLLSKIAPTVLYNWQGTPTWKKYFDFMAKTLGREEIARKAWDDYHDRVEALKTALGDRYKDKTISFVYFCCQGVGSQSLDSFAGSILEDIGLKRPAAQAVKAQHGEIYLSEEELTKADGDVIFVAAYTDSDKANLEQMQKKSLWRTLKAVQQNRVYRVDAETWRDGNLMAANAVIDDLYKYLVNIP
ncbi:MAG: iron-siderophore ABC transporter substrate-binding protein [Leptolyngbyaceae cyanobacterium CSU_1_3]|nr:iron-siderophore ABC transporter substrate-binding protein [Leptolyngbyaceae cyanobacterium CSU_1_3]